jgi:hypothetical protein
MNNLNNLPVLIRNLVGSIVSLKDFPQVEMTVKFAKNTKLELQFIYIGRVLGETYFKENNNKSDDFHRDWLMNLNPEKEISINVIPEKFNNDASIIIGYILALKFSTSGKQITINNVRNFLEEVTFSPDAKSKKDEILFYCFFWLGLLNQKLSSFFQTSFSAKILLAIEKKSYQLVKNISVAFFDCFTEKNISEWCQLKAEKLRPTSKRFTEYCKMYSGESPKKEQKNKSSKRSSHIIC